MPTEQSEDAKLPRRQWTADYVVSHLGSVGIFKRGVRERLEELWPALKPRLIRRLKGEINQDLVSAAVLLLNFGEREGNKGLFRCLQHGDRELSAFVFKEINYKVPLHRNDNRAREGVALDVERLWPYVEPHVLAFAQIETDLFPRINWYAFQLALRLEWEPAGHAIQTLHNHRLIALRLSVLSWFARNTLDPRGIALARSLFADKKATSGDHSTIVSALAKYCEHEEQEVAEQAAEMLCAFLRKMSRVKSGDWRTDNAISNDLDQAMDGLAKLPYRGKERALLAVWNSPVHDFRRGTALQYLTELDQGISPSRMQKAFADPTIRAKAADILLAHEPVDDRGLRKALGVALRSEQRQNVLVKLEAALAHMGGDPADHLASQLTSADPYKLMWHHWRIHQITPNRAKKALVKAGCMAEPETKRMRRLGRYWREGKEIERILLELLKFGGVLYLDLRGSVEGVPPYDEMLKKVARQSNGKLMVRKVVQTYDEPAGIVTLNFRLNKSPTAFSFPNRNGYYNPEGFVSAANKMFAEIGLDCAFHLLYMKGDRFAFVVAPPTEFQGVARSLRLPLAVDVESAAQLGVSLADYLARFD